MPEPLTVHQHTHTIHHNTKTVASTQFTLLQTVQKCTKSSHLALHSHIHHIWSLHSYRVLELFVTVEGKALDTHIGLALVWLASPSTLLWVQGLASQTSPL